MKQVHTRGFSALRSHMGSPAASCWRQLRSCLRVAAAQWPQQPAINERMFPNASKWKLPQDYKSLESKFNADGGTRRMGVDITSLKNSTTTQKLRLPVCALPSHPAGDTSLKPTALFSKHEADKWHHLLFTQAEDQEKLTDMASLVVCFKVYFIYFNMLGFHWSLEKNQKGRLTETGSKPLCAAFQASIFTRGTAHLDSTPLT